MNMTGIVQCTMMTGLLLVLGCSGNDNGTGPTGGTGTIPDTVSFSGDVRPILVGQCAVSLCHVTGTDKGGFNMGGVGSAQYGEVRNKSGNHGAIIVAGNAAGSNLYLKTTASPPFLERMPWKRTPLTTTQQEIIRKWIDQGALDN